MGQKVNNKGIKIEASKDVDKISGDPHTWLVQSKQLLKLIPLPLSLGKNSQMIKQLWKNAASYVAKLKKLDSEFDTLKDAKQKHLLHNMKLLLI